MANMGVFDNYQALHVTVAHDTVYHFLKQIIIMIIWKNKKVILKSRKFCFVMIFLFK
jgi:hypothetical protein